MLHFFTVESILPLCALWRQSPQSLNWFAGASSHCFCIRQYFGWHADTGNRDQLLRACDRFFVFFLSSSLVTISCKENRSFTKKVWLEEGSSRRKWGPACHSVSIQPVLQDLSYSPRCSLARCHQCKRELEAAMLQTSGQPQSLNLVRRICIWSNNWIFVVQSPSSKLCLQARRGRCLSA